jgi:hypothetical protein
VEAKLTDDLWTMLSPAQQECAMAGVEPYSRASCVIPVGTIPEDSRKLLAKHKASWRDCVELPARARYLQAFFPFLTVDGGSNNKFNSYWRHITVLTCASHRIDTVIKHVLDSSLTGKSAAAEVIQGLIAEQDDVITPFRSSPRLTRLLLDVQEETAAPPGGSKPRAKGFIGGCNTRWGYDTDKLERARSLLPYARAVVSDKGELMGAKWTIALRATLMAKIDTAIAGWETLQYAQALLQHLQLWSVLLQSSEFCVCKQCETHERAI